MSKKLTDEEILAALGETDEIATLVEVEGASGSSFKVADHAEAVWFEANKRNYLSEYRFENIADLQDLDRLLTLELLSYRYASWLLAGVDYDGMSFDEKAAREHKQKIDQEIRLVKKHMGMDRKGRVESEQQSTADYLTNLLRRAKEFGIHRDMQITKAIDLFNELKKQVGLHERCDEEERRHLGVDLDQIFYWIKEVAIPEYDEIDAAFRKNQRIWLREVS